MRSAPAIRRSPKCWRFSSAGVISPRWRTTICHIRTQWLAAGGLARRRVKNQARPAEDAGEGGGMQDEQLRVIAAKVEHAVFALS